MHYRLKVWAAFVVLMGLVASGQAWAEFRPKVTLGGGHIAINGQIAIRFQAPNGRLSAAERATITEGRLRQLVANGVSPYSFSFVATKQSAKLYAGPTMLCVVTKRDAQIARTTPAGLAQSWVTRIRTLLLMPAIALSDRIITVPLGESRRVMVSGAAEGPIYTKSDNDSLATAVSGLDGRYVQVVGKQLGQAIVDVSVENEHAQITVYVKKYAGFVPGQIEAQVTGNPCPAQLISYAATQAVMRSVVTEPGATVTIGGVDDGNKGVYSGSTKDVKVTVRIAGDGYITYGGQVSVRVRNSAMPADDVGQLFYSNNPERLLKYQTLFTGRLEPGLPTRVLYHHQNAMGKRARFMVELINPNATPGTFRIFKGISDPLVDTVLVGYKATTSFMRGENANASVIEQVAPQSRLVLVSDSLGNLETSSGILQVTQTDGQPAYVRVAALPPGLDDAPVGAVTPTQPVMSLDMSSHIYPKPVKTLDTEYTVGQRWAFISIGRHAIGSHDAQMKLDGNYGVTYNINVKVDNPTDRTKKVMVIFDPTAGLASGVFFINGEMVAVKYAKPPAEISLASYQVKPGETRNLKITTVPVAGSNYPATLVVRS